MQRWISLIGGVALLFSLTGCLEGVTASPSSSAVALKPNPEGVQHALDIVYTTDASAVAKRAEMDEEVCKSGPDDTSSTLCSEQAMPFVRALNQLKAACQAAVDTHNGLAQQLPAGKLVNIRQGNYLNPRTDLPVTCAER